MRYINEFRPKVFMTFEMQLNSDVEFGKKEDYKDPSLHALGPLIEKHLNPKLDFDIDQENMA